MTSAIPTLKLRRSQPSGDKPVLVEFISPQEERLGTVTFPASIWRHFNKIIQLGSEVNQRQGFTNPLKITVEGFIPAEAEQSPSPAIAIAVVEGVDRLTRTLKVEGEE